MYAHRMICSEDQAELLRPFALRYRQHDHASANHRRFATQALAGCIPRASTKAIEPLASLVWRLLMNHQAVLERIVEWARSDHNIRASVLTGSVARDGEAVDNEADLDVEL